MRKATFLCSFIYLSYFVISLIALKRDGVSGEISGGPLYNSLFIAALFCTNLWAVIYCIIRYKGAEAEIKALLHSILPVLLIMLPGWLLESILPGVVSVFVFPTLYIIMNVILFSREIRIIRTRGTLPKVLDITSWGYEHGLTPRECEILSSVLKGKSNKSVAKHLYISTNTVKTHIKSILRKTGAVDRFSLLLKINRIKS
jgi:DNA-binding CsgD family transcriptional regulator